MPRILERFLLWGLLLLALSSSSSCHGFVVSTADEKDIELISNPHDKRDASAKCQGALLEKLLAPHQLIVTPMVTQVDTFKNLQYAKVFQVPIPVYHMQQPARLSANELAFKMVLVKEVSPETQHQIKEVLVPMEQAVDSWFPGYYWSPLVMVCQDSWQHVGWKFTSIDDSAEIKHGKLPHFYALLVKLDEKEQNQGIRIAGFKAPGWMVGAVLAK